jgi:hypothetical protein
MGMHLMGTQRWTLGLDAFILTPGPSGLVLGAPALPRTSLTGPITICAPRDYVATLFVGLSPFAV